MFEKYIQRENTIFEILQDFLDNSLEFILVGGYAVSAFKHRFSVDADIVIKAEDLEKFEIILKKRKFEKTRSKDLDNLYSTKFARFENKDGLTISVDLMINGMGMRQTDSTISFNKINKNSIKKTIKGIEKEVKVKIPVKELLIAMKLEAGRLTDFRDIVALSKDIDINKVEEFLKNSNKRILEEHVNNLLSLLDKREFVDSFKGVFMEKRFDIDIAEIKKLGKLLSNTKEY